MFKRTSRDFRLYFATDVHGSDRCFRKFLAAATVYEANAIILGGDIVGKAIVPITRIGRDEYVFAFQGRQERCSADELLEAKRRIGFNGLYPWVADAADVERLRQDPGFGRRVFEEIMVRQITEWCELAAQRLPPETICVITPGNDDPFAIDAILRDAARVTCPASLGNVNRTPWRTDREYDEAELAVQIDAIVEPAADGRPLVFNFHCPPVDSGLDRAIELDADLRPVLVHGQMVETAVGSAAVRDAILRYQPVAGLHGHIHESPGVRRIGRTVCVNPGSEYSTGVLKGVLLDLAADGRYHDHLLTSG
jgi:Icc-related predicted phosphoesterase